MNFLDSVEISGFWGKHTVRAKFYRDLNFLIGPNGSGKTTIINLIAAVLRGDIHTLYAISFDKISIVLKTKGANRKPIITVSKNTNQLMGSIEISYNIKEKNNRYGCDIWSRGTK